jgi:hypothetical protein
MEARVPVEFLSKGFDKAFQVIYTVVEIKKVFGPGGRATPSD